MLSWLFCYHACYCCDYYQHHIYHCRLTLSVTWAGWTTRDTQFLFYFPECLRGWLDYPGHSVLFSRPLVASLEFTGGLSRHYSCGYPIGISLQVLPWCHLTSDRHFFSRPLRGVSRVIGWYRPILL